MQYIQDLKSYCKSVQTLAGWYLAIGTIGVISFLVMMGLNPPNSIFTGLIIIALPFSFVYIIYGIAKQGTHRRWLAFLDKNEGFDRTKVSQKMHKSRQRIKWGIGIFVILLLVGLFWAFGRWVQPTTGQYFISRDQIMFSNFFIGVLLHLSFNIIIQWAWLFQVQLYLKHNP
jgi:amino acid transporter